MSQTKEKRGDITLYQRKEKGAWWYEFTIQGQRVRKSCDTTNKKIAWKIATAEHERRYRNVILNIEEKEVITLLHAATIHVEQHVAHLSSAYTVERQLAEFVAYAGSALPLHYVDDAVVAHYLANCRSRGNSNATCNRKLMAVHKLLERSKNVLKFQTGKIDISLHKLREREPFTTEHTESEIAALIDAASPHLKPAIEFFVNTGIRHSNLVTLTWRQVDLDRRIMTLKVKSGRPGKKQLIVPLNQAAMDILSELNPQESGNVFLFNGKPIKSLRTALRRAYDVSGVVRPKGQLFHALRHTAAKRLFRAGVDPRTIQQILGHSDIATTMKYLGGESPHKLNALEAISFRHKSGTHSHEGK